MRVRLTCTAVVAAFALAPAASRTAAAQHAAAPAPYAVGTATTLALDSTRHGADSTAPRPVQITVWYPAQHSGAGRFTYGDYFDLTASEHGPVADSAVQNARAGYRAFAVEHGLADTIFTKWLTAPMLAVRDAAALKGRRPLIVIVNGNGQSAQDQSTLAEYLASYGYVVATTPSYTRISAPPASESDLGSGAEEQADDIAFVVARMRTRADVDPTKLGLVAHSLGARGALLYQMRTGAAKALVSLDGGIGTATGRAPMEQARSFNAKRLTVPVLHVYERLDDFMTPDFALLDELTAAPVWLAQTSDMHHIHFTSLGEWSARLPEVGALIGATPRTANEYEVVVDVTRAFLDTYVKGDRRAFPVAMQAASREGPARAAISFSRLHPPGRKTM
jgi:dienelactone hydrolase